MRLSVPICVFQILLYCESAKLLVFQERYFSTSRNYPLFNHLGTVYPQAGVADLVCELDLTRLYGDLSAICRLFNWFNTTFTVPNNEQIFSVAHTLHVANQSCANSQTQLTNLLHVLKVPAPERTKRQLFVGMALATLAAGVGGYIFGDSHGTSQSDLQLLKNQEHLIQVVRGSEHTLKLQGMNIERLREVLNDQISLAEINAHKVSVFVSLFVMATYAAQQAIRIMEVISTLILSDNLSPQLFPGRIILEKLAHLQLQASLKTYQLAPTTVLDVLSCKHSYLVFQNGTIRIAIHLPVISKSEEFELFEYNGLPIAGQNNQLFYPVMSESGLALRNLSLTYFSTQCDLCVKFAIFTVCKSPLIIKAQRLAGCDLAVYQRNISDVLSFCKLKSVPLKSHAWELSTRNFLVYHPEADVLRIVCFNKVVSHLSFKGIRIVQVPPNCAGINDYLTIRPQFLIASRVSVYTLSFPNISLPDLQLSFPKSRLIKAFNKTVPVIIHDPAMIFPPLSLWNHMPYYASSASVVCFVLMIGVLFCKYRRLRIFKNANPMPI